MKFLKTDFKPPKSKKKDISDQFWIRMPRNNANYNSEVQRLLFSHGYKWGDGSTTIQLTSRPLFWVHNKTIYNYGDYTYQQMLEGRPIWICSKTAPSYNYLQLKSFLNN